ncbi:nuclear transport factor 2 family protein [Mongoliibacter ruber]|uniref:Putative lumazine-binding protein n=1 Tax=Mongoliibacter ruber TaxID=1750599 RepID=A0A2T0WTF8_9BACT|nr:nuclear transport factor 2 family protein [Mongoliibacter ruber]PRY89992.1 putative lumazine-binding protein [Mongoliibacter ruber]
MRVTFLLIGCLFLTFTEVFAQSENDDKKAIAETIQFYFEGMMERDKAKLDKAFDPSARLIGYRGENFTVTPYEEWALGTDSGTQKRDPKDFENRLLDIDIKGYTAIAKTELFWPGIYYYDFLTLIKVDGNWKIVHKTWYEEKR